MVYRNKTYVAFDGDNDIRYYNLMKAWRQRDNTTFNFYDAHDINTARDSSIEESIKRQLRVRMANSKVFVLLIGDKTRFLHKFVKWEIETAKRLKLPIICVNLNNSRVKDNLCPAALNDTLAIFVPFEKKIVQYALENWSSSHETYLKQGKNSHYYYKNSVYDSI